MAGSPPTDYTIDIGSLPLAAAVVASNGVVKYANLELLNWLGCDPCGANMVEFIELDRRAELAPLLAAPGGAKIRSVALRVAHSDIADVAISAAAMNGDGDVALFFTAEQPSDLGSDPERALTFSPRVDDIIGHGIVVGDGQRIFHVTDEAAILFGRSASELIELGSLFPLFQASEQERIQKLTARLLAAGEPLPEHFETVVQRPDGSLHPVELWVKASVDDQERLRTYTLITDASERRSQQQQLVRRALHDQLTGLPNRYLLLDRLEMVLRQLTRSAGHARLCLIDLDRFKPINDKLGHSAGDEVLRITAQRLRLGIRSCDTPARLGGDEFVVLCGDTSHHDESDTLVERLRSVLEEPINADGWTVEVGASIGIVNFDDGQVAPETLLARADIAMYEAKQKRLQ